MKRYNKKHHSQEVEAGYKPQYKFGIIWNTLVQNVNAILEKAEDDLCGGYTTWGHGGMGYY